jgi:hypothetical protein
MDGIGWNRMEVIGDVPKKMEIIGDDRRCNGGLL